ncbi:hypothetical protein MMC10_011101 [Thelotrema lepadinum]|nr:hypothetical protein [Thelotrema lepadinum]
MHLKPLLLAPLLGLASADLAQFTSDLRSLASSIGADPSVRSMFEGLTTLSPSQSSQLAAAEAAAATQDFSGGYWSAAPAEYSAFPSPFNSFYLSLWTLESSLAVKDGVFTDALGAAPTNPTTMTTPASAAGGATTTPVSSGGSSPSSAGGSSASVAAGSSGTGSSGATSTGGAATPTGMVAMGAIVGIIGGVAALL